MSEVAKLQAHLLFTVANTHWAVNVSSVQKVHEQLTVQSVPGTHSWFLGLAPVDGQLLPVTDLGAWFMQSPAQGPILHLSANLGACGLQVDEVNGTQTIAPTHSALDATHTLMPGARSEVITANDKNFRILQMSLLVQSPAFVAIREAVAV